MPHRPVADSQQARPNRRADDDRPMTFEIPSYSHHLLNRGQGQWFGETLQSRATKSGGKDDKFTNGGGRVFIRHAMRPGWKQPGRNAFKANAARKCDEKWRPSSPFENNAAK